MTRVRLADRTDADIARQVRGARAMIGWSQSELAARAGIAARTIADLETGCRFPRGGTIERIVEAFFQAGMELIEAEDGIGLFLKTGSHASSDGQV